MPCLVVSPFARRNHVSHVVLEHTSILRMIEWRWNLPPLTVRDAQANSLADALDFSRPRLDAKPFAVPAGQFGEPCITARVAGQDQWDLLRDMADRYGWPA